MTADKSLCNTNLLRQEVTYDVKGVVMTGEQMAFRLMEVLDERVRMNHQIHGLKQELKEGRAAVSRLTTWLGVDENDEVAVRKLVEDLKAFKRFKSRTAKDKLRDGEGYSADQQAHYEQKLAGKKRRIRELERVVAQLRTAMNGATICHCGRLAHPRDPDPWEGRLNGFCHDCALARCDTSDSECPHA